MIRPLALYHCGHISAAFQINWSNLDQSRFMRIDGARLSFELEGGVLLKNSYVIASEGQIDY